MALEWYFTTGASSGIGKALAEAALQRPDAVVVGISRRKTIEHRNFIHYTVDLAQLEAVQKFGFDVPDSADAVFLINNAGTLGDVGPIGQLNPAKLIEAYNVNLVAPAILSNRFVADLANHPASKTVLNISSGAGKYPVDGWSIYCSTKAGLDLFSEVGAHEAELGMHPKFKFLTGAPGIVDTAMQDDIRKVDASRFSRLDTFINYHKNGELSNPKTVAEKYLQVLHNPPKDLPTNFSLRDL